MAAIAKSAGALLMVDNVFATPMLQKPLQLGADVVIYSATKHIDGQGRCLGGVVLSNTVVHSGPSAKLSEADWPLAQPLQRLGAFEGA